MNKTVLNSSSINLVSKALSVDLTNTLHPFVCSDLGEAQKFQFTLYCSYILDLYATLACNMSISILDALRNSFLSLICGEVRQKFENSEKPHALIPSTSKQDLVKRH